jgi:Glycosyl transferase family 2
MSLPSEIVADPRGSAECPVVSIILVCDYASGEKASWEDARATLRGVAAPVEHLLVERQGVVVPEDVLHVLPGLRLVRTNQHASFAMKNEGVCVAKADLVVLLDLDCVPERGWLRAFVAAMRRRSSVIVVSGRTVHAGRSLTEKILGLLARGHLDPGRAGPTRYVANQNAGYRRGAYLAHPLPGDTLPFTSTLQSEEIRRDGGELWFEPEMRAVHEYPGWKAHQDICINAGYGTVLCRLRDPHMPYAWLTRLGFASIPLFIVGKIIDAWVTSVRCARSYDIPWVALPYTLTLAIVTRAMEAPGMLRAFRGESLDATAYR